MTNGIKNLNDNDLNTSFFSNWNHEMDWADVFVEGIKGAVDGLAPGSSLLLDMGGEIVKAGFDLRIADGGIYGNVIPKSWADFGLKTGEGILTSLTCAGLSYASGQMGNGPKYWTKDIVDFNDCLIFSVLDGVAGGILGLPFSYGHDAIENYRMKPKFNPQMQLLLKKRNR